MATSLRAYARSVAAIASRRRPLFGLSALSLLAAVNWKASPRFSRLVATSSRCLTRLTVSPFESFSSSLSTTMPNPPQPPPSWTHSPEDVTTLTKQAIEEHGALLDKVGKLPSAECNFNSVFLPIEYGDTALSTVTEPLFFYQNVAPSSELRDASNAAEVLQRDYSVEASMRVDVFQARQAAEKNMKSSGEWDKLSPEAKRVVEKSLLAGKRAGLALPEKERKELKELKKELSQVCLEFSKNFNEEKGVVTFTLEELEGVPRDVVSGYTKRVDASKEVYDVTFKTPDIFPLFKYAQNPETRRRATEAYEARLTINVPILSKALDLRRKITKLLGYPTWADYNTEDKMAKSASNVMKFLEDLEQRLRPLGLAEREKLLALKQSECKERGLPFDGEFYMWDYRYYDRKFIEQTLDLDDSLVKEYFPVSVIVPAVLEIYQKLLGVRFEEIKEETWHPDVQQFSVWEHDAKDGSGFLGYCYLDLFPRPSKYSHAAVWPLLQGYKQSDGKRHYPVTAMVANLAKPTPDKPALMRHADVVTFFHEMGHAFHGLLSRTEFARFHGTEVAGDFVEAPSQMLEYWCWEPEVLRKMSSHYKSNEPLPADLVEKIIKSRYVNVGLSYLRQLFFAKFDMKVHTDQEEEDYTQLWDRLRERISLVKTIKRVPGQGTFSHIVGGYDAGYYGYMYSLVFAADMYATVFKKAPLDPALGKRYRDKILCPGGSREETESLEDFLGRPSNSDAFMKEMFGNAPGANL